MAIHDCIVGPDVFVDAASSLMLAVTVHEAGITCKRGGTDEV